MIDMILPLALPGVPILAVLAVGCIFRCKGTHRDWLVRVAAVFLTALALYFGGLILLGFFGLTWRNLPAGILCGVLLVSGWAGIVLTLANVLPMEWPNVPCVLRWASKAMVVLFAAVVLLVTLWLGPLIAVMAYGGEEQVVEYQGQTLVERDESWLDPDYSYYEYHGPLFRGTKRIYSQPTHIYGGIG